ncbi:minor pili exported protein [Yersinia intermedia]|jgi:type 1 fimbria pilin|uniref:fimbrial protein n=1 Tax=Yersinia intermedia TaxID=631 RepID=UPI0005E00500|nr:fimbrial protein [Yersinia intermedia]MCB5322826.1 fimbrial protein [Yersinia intermedia]UZM72359.1 fimbrial protein [Yersinia intermedia]CNC53401.1 minor pili exported protein [Yersinia intermedia]CNG59066.1 minor pili exported protein [Yersinia intermedia]
MTQYLTVVLLLLGSSLSTQLLAADNVLFRGTLIEAPLCTINNNNTVDVNFGDKVGVNKVDGTNYLTTIDYLITCNSGATGFDMTLMLSGNKTTYDDAAIKTDHLNLGIRVLQNGKPFTLGKPVAIDPKNPPKLEAVPVKTPGSTLTGGAFLASATLQANYQ